MTNSKTFDFKEKDNHLWPNKKADLFQFLKKLFEKGKSIRITAEQYDFRSLTALKAYWVLIRSIVVWDASNNGYNGEFWNEYFKREVGLIEQIDLMPIWKMKYKKELDNGWKLIEDTWEHGYTELEWFIVSPKWQRQEGSYIEWGKTSSEEYPFHLLGNSVFDKARSISNEGDVTKEEMERLLNCVLKFGAENKVPNCQIKNDELVELLRFYES